MIAPDVAIHPRLLTVNEILVEDRTEHAGGGVAHADGVGSGRDLGIGVHTGNIGAEVQQVANKSGIVEEIGHDAVEPAQLGGQRERALDPAYNRDLPAGLAAHDFDRTNAVEHTPAWIEIREKEGPQASFVGQRRTGLLNGGTLILEPFNAVISRDIDDLTCGIRTSQQNVDIEIPPYAELCFGECGAVARVIDIRHSGVPCREHHEHGLAWKVIDRQSGHHVAHPFHRIHRTYPPLVPGTAAV